MLALVAPEFEALPNSKADYEPYLKAMSAANKPASTGLFGEYLDLDVTARDTGASPTSFLLIRALEEIMFVYVWPVAVQPSVALAHAPQYLRFARMEPLDECVCS